MVTNHFQLPFNIEHQNGFVANFNGSDQNSIEPGERDATTLRNIGSIGQVGKDCSITTIPERTSTGLMLTNQISSAPHMFNTPSNCYQAVSSVNLPRREQMMITP